MISAQIKPFIKSAHPDIGAYLAALPPPHMDAATHDIEFIHVLYALFAFFLDLLSLYFSQHEPISKS